MTTEERELIASLQVYLEELRESGVDALPFADPVSRYAPSRVKRQN